MATPEQGAADRCVRRWSGGNDIVVASFRSGLNSVGAAVSARKLAASLWRLAAASNGGGRVRWYCDRLGFEFCSSTSIPKSAEGVTKWDNCNSRAWGDFSHFQSSVTHSTQRERVSELERVSRMKKKLADDIKRERNNSRKTERVNLKLLHDTAEAKLSARRFIRNREKEKNARVQLQELRENLVKDIEGTKVQIRALRNHRKRIQMVVEEERKIMQIAEVWREEQAQTKMADAKLILEGKYAEISNHVADLKVFMNFKGEANVRRKSELLMQDFSLGSGKGVKNFMFKFPKSDKGFAIVRDSQESNENASQKLGAGETSSLSLMQSMKKGSSTCKLLAARPRSYKDACKTTKTDGSSDRSASVLSPQGMSSEREIEFERNPHVIRAMKGQIVWPRKIQKREFTSNLVETIASEKTVLRNVLKPRS